MMWSHLVLGFVTSYLGYLPPSMLNITASKLCISKNKGEAHKFVWGVSLVVLLQVFTAVFISGLLQEQQFLLRALQKVGVLVLGVISVLFLYKGWTTKEISKETKGINSFILGLMLSLINMFAIPFFIVEFKLYMSYGWLMRDLYSVLFFALGAAIGVLAVLYNYVFLADKFQENLAKLLRFFTLGIGILTGIVAVYYAVKLYF